MTVYITGDKHGDFTKLRTNISEKKVGKDDTVIILGDSCANYLMRKLTDGKYVDTSESVAIKRKMNGLGIKLFIIQGNHEAPAWTVHGYENKEAYGGSVCVQRAFPNLYFAKNSEIYELDGKRAIVCGGAYSVDKNDRLLTGRPWFQEEQMSSIEMRSAIVKLRHESVDYVLTHACPLSEEPKDKFRSNIDQTKVDKVTESFLQIVKETTHYEQWYCGHYHFDENRGSTRFMYEDLIPLGSC